MKNEYNDFQILSPANMELMAKKYYAELNKQKFTMPKDNNIYNSPHVSDALALISQVKQKMELLKKFCSNNFYAKKSPAIKNISSSLNNILSSFEFAPKQPPRPQRTNYCNLITSSIEDLSSAITHLIKALETIPQNQPHELHSHILNLLALIKDIASLIGECRYRWN